MYRHALPPGFVLKSEMKAIENAKNNEMSMEMLVEKERASLGKTVTKVTLETFLAWKKRKLVEKKEEKVNIVGQVYHRITLLYLQTFLFNICLDLTRDKETSKFQDGSASGSQWT